jgi:hypothetical protein
MITIGCIPRNIKGFFRPLETHFAGPAWRHFRGLALGMAIGHVSTIKRLVRLLRNSTHRTNHGEFLPGGAFGWRGDWSESTVLQQIALDSLCPRPGLRPSTGSAPAIAVDSPPACGGLAA